MQAVSPHCEGERLSGPERPPSSSETERSETEAESALLTRPNERDYNFIVIETQSQLHCTLVAPSWSVGGCIGRG